MRHTFHAIASSNDGGIFQKPMKAMDDDFGSKESAKTPECNAKQS